MFCIVRNNNYSPFSSVFSSAFVSLSALAVASADFSTATYAYQWKKGGTSISGAINSSYTFDALASTLGVYTVSVSALSAGVSQAVVNSGNITLSSVAEDTVKPFDVYDRGTESGRERHRRMHHLGYI